MSVSQVAERSAAYQLQTSVKPVLGMAFDLLATAPQGVAKLRQLILLLAIEGKLAPQNSSDETASDLLKAIRMESHRDDSGARQKAIQAELDADCIGAFEVPDGWAWSQLGNVVNVVRGITFPASEKTRTPLEGRIACLRTTNVQSTIEWDDLLFVDRSFMSRDEQLVCPLDIIMSTANSRELVGKVAIVDEIPWPEATIGGFIAILRPRRLNPRYLMTLLRTDYARSALIDSSSQTTNIANISLAKLRPLPVPVPPIAEQARIVARVEELMQLCDALEAHGQLQDEQHARLVTTLFDALAASESAHALAENWQRIAAHFDLLIDRPDAVDTLEQTILQLAVRGLLVPQDPADEPASQLLARIAAEKMRLVAKGKAKRESFPPAAGETNQAFELPVQWVWAKLEQISTHVTDGAHHTPQYLSEGVPFLSVKNLSAGFLDFSDTRFISERAHAELTKRCYPELGDLLLTKIGTTGIAVVIDDPRPFSIFVSVALIKLPGDMINRDYLSLVINSPFVRKQSENGTEGVGNKNLVLRKIKAFDIPVPPLAEQLRIVARVEQLRRLCNDLRERLTEARATQSQLANALVSAKLVADARQF